jgi:hypothetical protein
MKTSKRILVCGGRTWGYTECSGYTKKDPKEFNLALDILKSLEPTVVISGGAKGADELGPLLAGVIGCKSLVYLANWKQYENAAGPIRNQQMLDEGKPDIVVAFPGGTGTADMVRRARKAGVVVIEVTNDENF